MAETYRINNTTLTFSHLIYVDAKGSDITGDGSKIKPFATYQKAESKAVNNDAVIFNKGIFNPEPFKAGGDAFNASFFLASSKSISIIGQGLETVIIADAEKYHPSRDEPIFGKMVKGAYCLNIKYTPYNTVNYNNPVFHIGTTTLYNVAIENISKTYPMSMNYWNGGTGGSLVNCVIKSNGKNVGDYTGKLVTVKDTLFDWDYKNATNIQNKLVRTVTDNDIEKGIAMDLATVGVWAGEFAWKNSNNNLYLYQTKTKEAYGMNSGVFTKLADNWSALTPEEQKALFISTDYETATAADLQTLGKFKILSYAETEDKPEPMLTAIPHDQLVTPKGLINVTAFEGIDNATLTSTISGSSSCKLLVTTDLTTYQTYDLVAQEWQTIDHTDLAAVRTSGIDATQLQNIDHAAWDKLIDGKQGVGFAYLISIDSVADVCKIDQLKLQVDMHGAWKKAVHGTDYDYEYPANNLLQVSIKTNGDYKINYPG